MSPHQFASWVDAVIFVFSLENESSFEEVTQLHALLSGYRGTSEVALALVGTQGELGVWDQPHRDGVGMIPASLPCSPPRQDQLLQPPGDRGRPGSGALRGHEAVPLLRDLCHVRPQR